MSTASQSRGCPCTLLGRTTLGRRHESAPRRDDADRPHVSAPRWQTGRVEAEEPDLIRYFFAFDLAGHRPERHRGQLQLDGGTAAYRLLGRGVGVTGYDEADCLHLLADALDGDLPPLLRADRNPIIEEQLASEAGNVAWRGIWFPRLNMSGPTIG